ncbi:hypothetical protein WDU94_000596, partial [Cyamophila willieti]
REYERDRRGNSRHLSDSYPKATERDQRDSDSSYGGGGGVERGRDYVARSRDYDAGLVSSAPPPPYKKPPSPPPPDIVPSTDVIHQPPPQQRPRNYKLLMDPFLIKGCTKLYRYEGIVPNDPTYPPVVVKDPRSSMSKVVWSKLEPLDLPVPQFK